MYYLCIQKFSLIGNHEFKAHSLETFLFEGINVCGLSQFCWFVGMLFLWVTGVMRYHVRETIIFYRFVGMKVTHKIHEHLSPTEQ